jgi:hypothetical protein
MPLISIRVRDRERALSERASYLGSYSTEQLLGVFFLAIPFPLWLYNNYSRVRMYGDCH